MERYRRGEDMKQTFKKSFCLLLTLLAVLSMGLFPVFANAKEGDQQIIATLEQNGAPIVEQLCSMNEQEIKGLKESNDSFAVSAAEAWDSSRKTLGELVETKSTEVVFHEGNYLVTVKAEFKERNADIVFTYDNKGMPLSLGINPEYSFLEKMGQAGVHTIIGVGTVFLILLFLTFLIGLFKYVNLLEPSNRAKKAEEEAKAPAATPVNAAEDSEEELADDSELVAVITAAIAAASESQSTDGFRVRSIKRISNWKKSER